MDSMERKTMNLHPETRPAEAYKPFPTGSKPERGQSLVEFSISAVIILILLMGVIDFGWAYFTVVALNDAAQEGATYGSICPNDTGGIVLRLEESAQDPVRLERGSQPECLCLCRATLVAAPAVPQCRLAMTSRCGLNTPIKF
jgi:hypothetical protein